MLRKCLKLCYFSYISQAFKRMRAKSQAIIKLNYFYSTHKLTIVRFSKIVQFSSTLPMYISFEIVDSIINSILFI